MKLAQTQEQRLQMTLAPHLRQSLELLQVPILQLRTIVQQELEKNPTLEELAEDKEQLEIEPNSEQIEDADAAKELDFKEEYEVLAKLDDEWREHFQQNLTGQQKQGDAEQKREHMFNTLYRNESLQEHLLVQLTLANLTSEEVKIGELLIGNINDDGYLATSLEEISLSTGIETHRLETVLYIIQEFDPIGVGARDLRETLLLQLERLGKDVPVTVSLIDTQLKNLAAKRYLEISRALKISIDEVQENARFIATLEPKPGRMFSTDNAAYILPEIHIEKRGDEFVVNLEDKNIPRLRISRHYRHLMDNPDTPDNVKKYIGEKIRASLNLIKGIEQRQNTIHRIATEIAKVQHEFLEKGVKHLNSLKMSTIAEKLSIHETTVSRAIAGKYIRTPQGVFEAKYFFTPGYQDSTGKDVSNEAVKNRIAELISDEDTKKPYSDQALVKLLKAEGLTVARRTIAKYRDQLNILPSSMRRSF